MQEIEDVERAEAVVRAFRLVHDIQAALPGATEALDALATRARDEGWDDVERICLFGAAVRSWIAGDGRASEPVASLIERSTEAGDHVMLALGLALRSDAGFFSRDLPGATGDDEDLARAIVLLENEEGRSYERISAHTACAIALASRWLFELSHEQYEAAIAIGGSEPSAELDFLLAPIHFNLAEEQVSWASKLFELGDDAGVRQRWASWSQVVAATRRYPMSDSWRVELEALGLVLRGLAGDAVIDEAEHLLAGLDGSRGGDGRASSLLRLAVAVELSAERREDTGSDAAVAVLEAAEEAVDAAVAALSPTVHPFKYDLALFLAAKLEARAGAGAGLRYAGRVTSEQWAKRDAALTAMRAQIASVRLASERELLIRRARLDDLTGIANRWSLEEFVSDLIRHGVERCALVLFDVDSFKEVNDLYGHLAGDRLLVRIAEVLSGGIRSTDLAVRLGGDEFAVILAGAGAAAAHDRAEVLVQALAEEPLDEIAAGLCVSVSAGVAVGEPSTIMEMWAAADAALYAAKAAGGRAVHLGHTGSA
ncbi:MAG: GGDEF domain-containing protein [Actinomycetota bacterium]|nr:GGDEF domain-containing protein [Actinomycetota bacterium]